MQKSKYKFISRVSKKLSLLIFLTLSMNITSFAIEICDNGIDDDQNGLIDCADPTCSTISYCLDAFTCSNDLYQVISGVLKVFDPATSTYTIVGESGMGSYNGAGYNVQDGYIYGIKAISGTNHVIKINNTGEASDYGAVSNWSGATYRADIDESGNWYSYTNGNNPTLHKIDLDVFPLTMETVPLTNLYGASIPNVADLTFNANTNLLYGMASGNILIEIDPVNLTVDVIANYEGTGAYGAAWSDIDGNSFFSNNSTGYIYMIPFDLQGNPIEFKHIAYGEITGNNDGINCMLSLPPLETSCDDNIDNDGDGNIDEADIYCLEVPTFTPLTGDPFVNDAKNSWGITILDYNNDSFDDIYVPNYDKTGTSDIYINNGNGNFTKSTGNDAVLDLSASVAGSAADFNNDGFIDLAVANNIGSASFLYENNSTVFDNTNNEIFANADGYSHSISYVDYDNDGYVDVFISDFFESKFNLLYRNNGDETFTKITEGDIVNDAIPAIGSTWSDVNNDGFQDLFVPVKNGNNILYINNGDRSFEKVLFDDTSNSVGSSFADIDNDGDMDLFVANASKQDNFLYTNDGNGNFTLVSDSPVIEGGGDSHGSAFGDYDNDGWIDLFVTNDKAGVKFFFLNDGTGNFNRSLVSPIIAPEGNSFGVANADFNHDGNLDLAIANHSNENNYLYLNDGNGNKYVNVRLTGTNSNASALGARIYVTAEVNGETITQMREVSGQTGGGPGSQNSLSQHFGLLDATTITNITVKWPSGYEQTLTNIPSNQFIEIVEDNGSLISGTIYNDANQNCIQDAGETGIANQIVTLTPGPIYTITDENGYYESYVKQGNYNISQDLGSNFTNTCQGSNFSYPVSVSGIGLTYTDNDFANYALQQLPDLSVDLGVSALRKGATNSISVSYANYGVVDATNAQLVLTVDNDIDITGSSLPWDMKDGNTYTWDLGTLGVNQSGNIELANFVSLSAPLNANKTFSVSISSTEDDMNLANNTSNKNERIVGSFDPNDIQVSPTGFGPNHQIKADEILTYKIRFQNVGNFEANSVIVIDTLPETLDITTFVQGASSHQYTLTLLDKGIVQWEFNTINLPDSTTNEAASHGFVQFEIQAIEAITDGEKIVNKAAIKFDNNPFIITNEVLSTINKNLENELTDENQIFVYPNPADDFINVFYQASVKGVDSKIEVDSSTELVEPSIEIYSVDGSLVLRDSTVSENEANNISIQDIASGFYIVKYENSLGENYISKFIKK